MSQSQNNNSIYKGLIFDLDGVLVDTAKYHFIAWKQIADSLGIQFTEKDNERLKGVSRMSSFEIILEIGGRSMPVKEKEAFCEEKNEIYLGYVRQLREDEILDGVRFFLADARAKGYKIALGSASRNSLLILERLDIASVFDAIIDGNAAKRAKPDPEVFVKGAEALGLENRECIVFEDAEAGIRAAHAAGMKAVGVGLPENLGDADIIIPGFTDVTIDSVISALVS